MDEADLISVLCNSVYPGARLESVKMVVAWCRAQRKDPLKKPVHIMPTRVQVKDEKGKKQWVDRDVIMPGIGDYRTDASRSGAYMGMTEPEFGPWVEEELGGEQVEEEDYQGNRKLVTKPKAKVRYPEWCKVVVRRLVAGQLCDFPAIEFWRENYATKDRKTKCPNDMWERRPAGQLVKCTEAQALRKAFPELGSAPTAEEMEGKVITLDADSVIEGATGEPERKQGIQKPQAKAKAATPPPQEPPTDVDPETGEVIPPAEAKAPEGEPAADAPPAKAPPAANPVTPGMLNVIRAALRRGGKDEAALCKALGVESLEALDRSRVNEAVKLAEVSL